VNKDRLTKARRFWNMSPIRGKDTMPEKDGEERHGNLVLKGSCAKCAHAVARVVETSQTDSSGN
jgi:hypothetical protein